MVFFFMFPEADDGRVVMKMVLKPRRIFQSTSSSLGDQRDGDKVRI